jgi:hypothetical protein
LILSYRNIGRGRTKPEKGNTFFSVYTNSITCLDPVFQISQSVQNPIVAAFRKKGDIVIWQNNIILILDEDEQLSPTFEEIILINILDLVNEQLLDCVRYHYQHLSRPWYN